MTTESTRATQASATDQPLSQERSDLLAKLATHRHFLRFTVRDLTDEQARLQPTASELSLGGLIKHVADTEANWMRFAVGGAEAMEDSSADWGDRFKMLEGETLAGLLDQYAEVARRTDELVVSLPDLDQSHPLPVAPWFEPGATWSARLVLLHVIAETAQHAGHADIIRESIDGSRTMG
jgi:uncharacterized damage-inducible protein DinB